jgi:hypothetical protein
MNKNIAVISVFALCSLLFALFTTQAYATVVLLNNPDPSVPAGTNYDTATGQYTSAPLSAYDTSPKPCTNGTCGLVVCDAVSSANGGSGQTICDFNAFLKEIRTVINWLFVIAIPIAIVLFAYGGILYILGTPGNRKKANGVFTATGIGFGIMLIAWVSVYTIVSWLTAGNNGSTNNPTGITTFLGN